MKIRDKPKKQANHTALVHPPVLPAKRKGSRVLRVFR